MGTETVREVLITAIDVVSNPRKRFDDAKLQSLAESIERDGLVQPILVRPTENGGTPFELVAGERRLKAHGLLGRDMIRATIREMDAKQAARIRLVENLHREDLHELDEAQAFQELLEDEAYTVPMLAAECGRSESYVYQRLKLLDLVDEARGAFAAGEIPAAHALAISRLKPDDQEEALKFARGGHGGPPSTAQLQNRIAHDILMELGGAPFDPEDAELVPEAGPCTTCPKRTGNAPGLWPELDGDDRCTDRSCFNGKVDTALHAAVEAGCVPVYESWEARPKGFKGAVSVDYNTKLRGGDKCPHREEAIVIGRHDRGDRVYICREKACAKHGPKRRGLTAEQKEKRAQDEERLRRRRAVAEILEERILERAAPPDGELFVDDAVRARLLAELLFRGRNTTDQRKVLRWIDVEPIVTKQEWGGSTYNCQGPFREAVADMEGGPLWSLVWRLALFDVVDRAGWTHGGPSAVEPLEAVATAVGYAPHNAWRSVRAAAEVELPEDSA